MALMRGKLFAGALFAGKLFGAAATLNAAADWLLRARRRLRR